jgi:hypothetical protein
MASYKLLTGAFEGCVIEEGAQILDVDFDQLDDDMQIRIREWAEQLGHKYIEVDGGSDFAYTGGSGTRISMNQIKRDYEKSWDSEETEEDVDLHPASEW